jgi:rhodanese-related sulfurtransferase
MATMFSPNYGAIAALSLLSMIGYLFWRGTVVVMNARRLVSAGALLLDAGTPVEFSVAHIAGSVNIPTPDVARRQVEIGPWDRVIVVYARSGFRSARAAQALRAIGYHSVLNVGRMSRWEVPPSERWEGDPLPQLVGTTV